jgi:hypothetical protein
MLSSDLNLMCNNTNSSGNHYIGMNKIENKRIMMANQNVCGRFHL